MQKEAPFYGNSFKKLLNILKKCFKSIKKVKYKKLIIIKYNNKKNGL